MYLDLCVCECKKNHDYQLFFRLPRTLYSLFWSMFGLISVDSVQIRYPNKYGKLYKITILKISHKPNELN